MRPNAFDAIAADLAAAARSKRQHFVPAGVAAAALVVALIVLVGVRDDFVRLPLWRQAALAGSWVVGGVLFPAVGAGLWFPSRSTRIGIAMLGLVLPVAAVVGSPWSTPETTVDHAHCALAVMGLGVALLGVAAFSGAFAQRRAVASTAWVAAGLSLAALATTSWICPTDEHGHILLRHVVPGIAVIGLALVVGRWLHRRQRR